MIVLVKDINLVNGYEYKVNVHKSETFSCTLCSITDREYKKQLIKGNVVQAGSLDWFLKVILLSILPEHKNELTPEQYNELEDSLLEKGL